MDMASESGTITLATMLRQASQRFGDATAFVEADSGRTISFVDLHRQADRLARHLIASGLAPGDMGGVLMGNRIEALVADFALMLCGVGRVLLMPNAAREEIEEKLGHLEAKVVVTEADLLEQVRAAAASLPRLEHLISVGGGEGTVAFEEALEDERAATVTLEVGPDDPCCLRFSSGTTGKPKAVLHDQGSFAAVTANQLYGENWGDLIRPGERFLQYLPLPVGPVFWIYSCFVGGATTVLTSRPMDELVTVIAEQQVTVTFFPPAVIVALAQDDAVSAAQLSSLRTAFYGGSPLTSGEAQVATEKFGDVFIHYYAASEYPLCTITNLPPSRAEEHREGSCGRVALGSEVRIVGDDDAEAAPGEVGELLVRGSHVFQEYWNNPDATALAKLRGGWARLGDMGYRDEDGYIFMVDRKHDATHVDGKMVFPSLIEEVLFGPELAEVAVVGVPLEEGSEESRLVAFVRYVEVGAGSTEELRARCEAALEAHEVPAEFVERSEPFPRSPLGKVIKRELGAGLTRPGRPGRIGDGLA
jgi:acyl-CoA synthetase (AMP-forming)/AMP-acid ligase II